ncbi:hypothetical protein SAMN05192574_104724 [Mucilaginibacter gossypiicola]|uniref:Uncharacterized protein n=1 Tax=Mucilaginibacter gossypiicola TaxID=551995 RepID=A0A1H8KQJ5_9SPHI|nr:MULTISPECIES: hypothetical protein [Mucilaginibacter]SEN95164.1 hypothetical protein SAMN05192574_104724 [Mucilaginibacter gossypiicola]
MKILKLIPKAKTVVESSVSKLFIDGDATIFAGTPRQFLKNNPKVFTPNNGFIA